MKKNLIQLFHQLRNHNVQTLLVLDFTLLPLALITSILLRLGGEWDQHLNHAVWIFIALPLWTIPIFINLGLYRAVLKYLDEKIVSIVLLGVSLSVMVLIAIVHFAHIYAIPKTSIIIFWVFALAYIGGSRLILRGILKRFDKQGVVNVGIYGAGSAGVQACLALQNGTEYTPVAFFDDDQNKCYKTIRGITIYSPQALPEIVKSKKITQLLVAIPSASYTRRKEIINFLEPLSLKIKMLPGIADLVSGAISTNDIKEVEIEDLLGRETIPANIDLLQKNITNKTVLVTGGGGSIGSELVRQIASLNPNTLIILDISEYALYLIKAEITIKFPNLNLVDILGSVTDSGLIDCLFGKFQINMIFHAAAYKHVPIVEFNPVSGIYNNTIGTYIVANAAMTHNVDNMVLISTDKAVRPTNVMGASKRASEMILQAFNQVSQHTIFTMVRFGNVLGSSGSVVPLFREQIKLGGPLTVTHPQIIRYFMTIPEAALLVIQAGNMASGGEVFVLDMGEPVKIFDLAKRMIHLSGLKIKDSSHPDGDIEIKFSGLRPGEKLFEELLIGNDPIQTNHPRIMKANEKFLEYQKLLLVIKKLETATKLYKTTDSIEILSSLVSDYQPYQAINYI